MHALLTREHIFSWSLIPWGRVARGVPRRSDKTWQPCNHPYRHFYSDPRAASRLTARGCQCVLSRLSSFFFFFFFWPPHLRCLSTFKLGTPPQNIVVVVVVFFVLHLGRKANVKDRSRAVSSTVRRNRRENIWMFCFLVFFCFFISSPQLGCAVTLLYQRKDLQKPLDSSCHAVARHSSCKAQCNVY